MSEPEVNFEGFTGRGCGDHRTVGPHRAWCFDCGEWCSPDMPCKGCEAVAQVQQMPDALRSEFEAWHKELIANPDLEDAVVRAVRAESTDELPPISGSLQDRIREDGQ